jgi:hypothetical protein
MVSLDNNFFLIHGSISTERIELDRTPKSGNLILHMPFHCDAEVSGLNFDLTNLDLLCDLFNDIGIDAYILNNNGNLVCFSDFRHYVIENDLINDELVDLLNIDF